MPESVFTQTVPAALAGFAAGAGFETGAVVAGAAVEAEDCAALPAAGLAFDLDFDLDLAFASDVPAGSGCCDCWARIAGEPNESSIAIKIMEERKHFKERRFMRILRPRARAYSAGRMERDASGPADGTMRWFAGFIRENVRMMSKK